MELLDDLLDGASPYLYALIYDIDERALVIECVKDPKKPTPYQRIIFTGITHYSETNLLDEPDDENLDDLVEITVKKDAGFLITTYKKEILVHTTEQPISEPIEDA